MPNKTLVDLYIVLSPNHDGGEDIHSVESVPEGAIEALRRIGEGRVVHVPQVEQWATYGGLEPLKAKGL
jgi:hypothetical protein